MPNQKQKMKYKLTKSEFEALEEKAQKEYTLSGDSALLKIEGDDAPTIAKIEALEKKRGIEVEHRKTAETKLGEAEARAVQLQEDFKKAGGNKEAIAALELKHGQELEKLRDERATETANQIAARNESMIKDAAVKFANERFTIPHLIQDQFAKRLSVEDVEGTPVVRVLGTDGKASTLNMADLEKEFLDNSQLSTIIKAKAGNGGGATPGQNGGATRKKLSEMTATEESAFEGEDPTAYAAALDSLSA